MDQYAATAPEASQHASYGFAEIGHPVGVQERVDQRVGSDEHEVPVAQPVNGLTAAAAAQVHQVDHHHRRNVAAEERHQHDQVGGGELALRKHGALFGAILVVRVVEELSHEADLLLDRQEHAHVRENEDEDRAEERDVGEHERVQHEAHLEEDAREADGHHPDSCRSFSRSGEAHVSAIPECIRDGQVAVYGETGQREQRRRAGQKVHELRQRGVLGDRHVLSLQVMGVYGQRLHHRTHDEVRSGQADDEERERRAQVAVGINKHGQDHEQVAWDRDGHENQRDGHRAVGDLRWGPNPRTVRCAERHCDGLDTDWRLGYRTAQSCCLLHSVGLGY